MYQQYMTAAPACPATAALSRVQNLVELHDELAEPIPARHN
jgi:hypothetical protein